MNTFLNLPFFGRLLSAITPENVNLVFNIAFFVIIGIIVLGFIFGIIRGFWKSIFRFIFIISLVLVAFFASRPIGDALAAANLQDLLALFGVNLGSFNFDFGGTPIIVEITSVENTLASFTNQLFTSLGITGDAASDAAALALAFTKVVIRYITFIILGLLIVTVGEFLAMLLYFFPFRFIFPKKWRKHHKLRLLGGLVNAVKVTVVTVMIMIPFTSLLNTINQAFRNATNAVQGIDDPTYNMIMGFLDAYNDSMFAQVMFNWTVSADGKTFDSALMDYITGEQLGDAMLTLSNELYTIAGIGQTILSSGIFTQGLNETTTQLLFTEDIIESFFVNLAASTIVTKMIPIAIAVAFNMEEVQEFVDPNLVDLDDIDWSEELDDVKDITIDIIRSGILQELFDGDEGLDPAVILPMLVAEDAYPHIRSALYRIDDSQLMSQVFPAVLYKLVNDELDAGIEEFEIGLSTFLPSQWEDYAELKFGEEIAIIYDVLYALANIDPELLPAILDGIGEDNPAGEFANSNIISNKNELITPQTANGNGTDLVDLIRQHSDAIIALIVGELDVNGLPVGVDEEGKTILFDELGAPLEDVSNSLLDSGLLIYGLDKLLRISLMPLLSQLADDEDFDTTKFDNAITILNGLNKGEKRFNYKGEFGAILGIVSAIFNNDDLLGLIGFGDDNNPEEAQLPPGIKNANGNGEGNGEQGLFSLFEDAGFREGIKNDICPLLDRSKIMGAVIPGLLESALAGFDDFLDVLDLQISDLNFEFTDVGTQFAILIDIVGYALNVVIDQDDIFENIADITDDIIGLLDSLYFSNIINPKDGDGIMQSDNYYTILKSVFGQMEGLGFDIDDIDAAARSIQIDPITGHDGWTTVYDELGNPVIKGENYNLIKFIETALTSSLFNLSEDDGDILTQMIDFAYDPDDPIGEIFKSVDSSVIISASFGGILDHLFGDTGGLVDPSLGTSFRNVTNWEEEGENLKFILISLDEFDDAIDDIDFLNSDADKIGDVLKGLAQSQIFNRPNDDYLFPTFLLNNFRDAGGIAGPYLYDPYEDDVTNDGNPYDYIEADFAAIGNTVATRANWYQDDGEIDKIVELIRALQDFGDGDDPFDRIQEDDTVTGAEVGVVMYALNDATSLRMLLYNVYDSMLGTDQFKMGVLEPAHANTFALLEISKEDRDIEIAHTVVIYDGLKEMTLNGATGEFNPEDIDEGIFSDLLNALHSSLIYNTFDESKFDFGIELEPRNYLNGDLTVFEESIQMIYETSTIDTYIYKGADEVTRQALLKADIMAIGNNFAGTEPLTIDQWSGAAGEIEMIVNIMVSFKDTGLSFDDFGSDGGNAFYNLMDDTEGTNKVEQLVLDVNESLIAHPAVPNIFDEIFTSGAFELDGVDINDANTDYLRNEPDKDERANEISLIFDIYEDIRDIGLTDGTPLTPSSIDEALLSSLLNSAHESKVFNTFIDGKGHITMNLTVFEQTIRTMIDQLELDLYIYEIEGTNDPYLTEDIIAVGNDLAGTLDPSVDGWRNKDNGGPIVKGEITRIVDILVAFKNTGIEFDEFGGVGSNDALSDLIDTETTKVEELLLAINRSQIAYPAIPNILANMLTTNDVSLDGVDFGDSNTHYRGNRGDQLADDKFKPYPDGEISHLLDIFLEMKNIVEADYDFTDLTSVTISDLDDMKYVVGMMLQSDVFHQSGLPVDASGPATVFEQIIIKMMDETGISELIDDVQNPNPLYYDGAVYKFDALNPKAQFLVVNFDSIYGSSSDHYTNVWEGLTGEIEALFRIFKEIKRALPTISNSDDIDPSDIAPDAIMAVISALNYSSLSSDAVPALVRDSFDAISLEEYTEGEENYYITPKEYMITDLNQMDYSLTDFTPLNPPVVVDSEHAIYDVGLDTYMQAIHYILNEFYTGGVGYIDMGSDFDLEEFITVEGRSSVPLFRLLEVSTIFGKDMVEEGPTGYRTRSLTAANIFDSSGIAKFINYNGEYASVENCIEWLFTDDIDETFTGSFYYEFEGERIDQYLKDLTQFKVVDDVALLDGIANADALKSMIEDSYLLDVHGDIIQRAYFVSEFTAGFYTSIFEDEYVNVITINPDEPKVIDFYENDYANLNPKEADGIHGSVSIITTLQSIYDALDIFDLDPDDVDPQDIDDAQLHFREMGSLDDSNVTGGPYDTPYNFDNWDETGNSLIAKLFYAVIIVQNPLFANFNVIMLLIDPLNPVLDADPYVDDFVFEIQGHKIAYVFG